MNKTQVSLIILIVVIVSAVVTQTINLSKKKELMVNIEECSKNAELFYNKIIQEVGKDAGVFGKIHEYYFNEKLNTCILWYQYGYDGVVVSYVKNIYTNQTLLSYGQTNGKNWDISLEDFTNKRKELFKQQ